ncbi:MAG TPA: tyrosine--tRNA ligase [Cyclobacteriaceae bacterium]|nr:tyrosine--tRNA ligase [Cyclobacteriaceae bacterium]HMV09480.1 tyrosine--tRNA ligase [Cyclobacteriaceae bacterium]HMV90084.1 tyrosine--tRNA ligase [Cyclobacteriaceae bacterium]HMX02687.1 tyrosine--tRNA ligase [Cyclobacteriaceae bacterium]HMX51590.1 tyrosine--tRNA ligase [Cyclobacteriaceae bacterium]
MARNFIEELRWRGMIHDVMPGTEEQLNKEVTSGYIGFDPTADSLHIGHLVQIMTLVHFQQCGHKPVALVGGATGMVGDPSGKSAERNLLSEEVLQHNVACVKKQLEKFLDFSAGGAELVNNYDWFKDFKFLDFIRDIGKHITVNYMMSKDSVQKRLESGLSFTEFTYQLVQGYDFYWLNQHKNCKLQMGGSDQWGNIVTGTELIRRKANGDAFALTTKLITKADGTKFGKTEGGNVWLDPKKTSPYKFYQYWLNVSDEDAPNFIRIFSLKTKAEIEALEAEHKEAPQLRKLQKALAEDITTRVHGAGALKRAQETTEVLFGASFEAFKSLSGEEIEDAFDESITFKISKSEFANSIDPVALLGEKTPVYPSKGEARKAIQGNGVSINKEKISLDRKISAGDLLYDKYLLAQKGKKNYYLIVVA